MIKEWRERRASTSIQEVIEYINGACAEFERIRDTQGQEAADRYAEKMTPIIDGLRTRAQSKLRKLG